MDINIKKLSAREIQELNVHAVQRLVGHNIGLLADIGNALFIATGKLGQDRIQVEKDKTEVDQLKHYKDIITEQNRAAKSVVSGG